VVDAVDHGKCRGIDSVALDLDLYAAWSSPSSSCNAALLAVTRPLPRTGRIPAA
jgi:hypothetical protein